MHRTRTDPPMPIVSSSFAPPLWLRGGHRQTLAPILLPRPPRPLWQFERLDLADGDFLELYWLTCREQRLAILSHGLEGSHEDGYIRGMARILNRSGWDVLAWDQRGCGAEMNRLPRSYHAGETGDLRAVIDHAASHYDRVALIGTSLGGNLTLKYLGESSVHRTIRTAVAVSAPIDLAASARAIDGLWQNWIYRTRFVRLLRARIQKKADQFPDLIQVGDLKNIRTFASFDDQFTAPLHGFRDAAHYWAACSAFQNLDQVNVPTLLLNALDDPFLAADCFPYSKAATHPWLVLETPRWGGHVGFLDFRQGWCRWSERRTQRFLEQ